MKHTITIEVDDKEGIAFMTLPGLAGGQSVFFGLPLDKIHEFSLKDALHLQANIAANYLHGRILAMARKPATDSETDYNLPQCSNCGRTYSRKWIGTVCSVCDGIIVAIENGGGPKR